MSGTARRQPLRHAHRITPPTPWQVHRRTVAALAVVSVLGFALVVLVRAGFLGAPAGDAGRAPTEIEGVASDATAEPGAGEPATPGQVQDEGFLVADAAACAGPTASPTASRRPGAGVNAAPVRAEHPRGHAVVLGDSYSSGWNGVGEGSSSWPSILGRAQDWRITNLAVAGTGYVNPGWTGDPMRVQVAAAIRLKPGIVIVASGHNDEIYAASTAVSAANAALNRLRAGLPNAVIVIVGPIWPDSDPDPTVLALRDYLHGKAADLGALWIDPIRAGWFTGTNHKYIGADGTHPTTAGYRRIATLLLAAFRSDPRLAATPIPEVEPVAPTPRPTPTPEPLDQAMTGGGLVPCPA